MLSILCQSPHRGVVRMMRRAVMMGETECSCLIIMSLFYILADFYDISNTFEHYPDFNMKKCQEE